MFYRHYHDANLSKIDIERCRKKDQRCTPNQLNQRNTIAVQMHHRIKLIPSSLKVIQLKIMETAQ